MEKSKQIGKLSFLFDAIALLSAIYFGLTYAANGFALDHHVSDRLFVVILAVATIFVVWATQSLRHYIITRGFSYWQYVLQEAQGEDIERALRQLMSRLFPSIRRIIAGAFYGSLIVFGIKEITTVPNGSAVAFYAFMFSVNYITGAILYSLSFFLVLVPSLIRNIPVQLWETKNLASEFIFGSTSRIAVFASIYVGLCMTSILFSDIPKDAIVIAYVMFSIGMALATIVAPFYFYGRQIQRSKDKMLFKIGVKLNDISHKIMDDAKEDAHPIEFQRMQELAQLREWIRRVEIFPFRMRTTYAALTAFLFALQPLVADLIKDAIERLW